MGNKPRKQTKHCKITNLNCTWQYKGVSKHTQSGRWAATIFHQGNKKHLGLYDDEIEAAEACDDAAKDLFGEYACVNFT